TLGTEWGRSLDKDLWLKRVQQHYRSIEHLEGYYVVTDVRFDNEAKWIKENGYLIEITRPGVGGGDHASEKGLNVHTDFVVVNDKGKLELWDSIRSIVYAIDSLEVTR